MFQNTLGVRTARISKIVVALLLSLVCSLGMLVLNPATAAAAPASTSPSQVSGVRFGNANYLFGLSGNKIVFRDIAAGKAWQTVPGGTLASGPSAVVTSANQVWVFALSPSGTLWVNKTANLTSWTGWTSLGGRLIGGPSVLSNPEAGADLVVAGRSPGGGYWVRGFLGGSWTPWFNAGTEVYTTSPAIWTEGNPIGFELNGVLTNGQFQYIGYEFVNRVLTRTDINVVRATDQKSAAISPHTGNTEQGVYYRDTQDRLSGDVDMGDTGAPTGKIGSTPAVINASFDGLRTTSVNYVCAKGPGTVAYCLRHEGFQVPGAWFSVGGNLR